jgi:hypothetical protein
VALLRSRAMSSRALNRSVFHQTDSGVHFQFQGRLLSKSDWTRRAAHPITLAELNLVPRRLQPDSKNYPGFHTRDDVLHCAGRVTPPRTSRVDSKDAFRHTLLFPKASDSSGTYLRVSIISPFLIEFVQTISWFAGTSFK